MASRASSNLSKSASSPSPKSTSLVSPRVSYDPLFHALSIPFLVLRPPKLRLKVPTPSWPGVWLVFSLIIASYFLVVSGFLYDVISGPPSMGGRQDPRTGAFIPEVFLTGRMNGQYIIEGLSAGSMLVLGGIGIILLDFGCDSSRSQSMRTSFLATGLAFVLVSYSMSMLFLRIKVPYYLH